MTVSRLLIRSLESPTPGELKRYQKGDIVCVVDAAVSPDYGSLELVNNVGVNITNGNFQNHLDFWQKWVSQLDFTPTVVSTSTDTWNIQMTLLNTSASGYGNLTKQKVDNYLSNHWNIEAAEVSANLVEFTEDVYDLAISPYMFNAANHQQIQDIVFQQIDYRSEGGEHDIEADYSARDVPPERAESAVSTYYPILSHDIPNKKITFLADRNVIFREFKNDAEDRLNELLGISVWRISDENVDDIVNAGRVIDRTQAQIQAALIDKRDF